MSTTLSAENTKSRQGAVAIPGTDVGDKQLATANFVTLVGGDGTIAAKPGVQDGGSAFADVHGLGTPAVPFTSANASAAAVAVTNAPTTGQKLVVTDVIISVAVDMDVTLKEETSGTVLLGPIRMAAKSTIQITPRSGALRCYTANKKVMVQTSITGDLTVDVHYHSEA